MFRFELDRTMNTRQLPGQSLLLATLAIAGIFIGSASAARAADFEIHRRMRPGDVGALYLSREVHNKADSLLTMRRMLSALEVAHYMIFEAQVFKMPTFKQFEKKKGPGGKVLGFVPARPWEYAFRLVYGAEPGYRLQPIRRYYRDGFPSMAAAKAAYKKWLAENKPKGAVFLTADMGVLLPPPLTGPHFVSIDYVYPLIKKASSRSSRSPTRSTATSAGG